MASSQLQSQRDGRILARMDYGLGWGGAALLCRRLDSGRIYGPDQPLTASRHTDEDQREQNKNHLDPVKLKYDWLLGVDPPASLKLQSRQTIGGTGESRRPDMGIFVWRSWILVASPQPELPNISHNNRGAFVSDANIRLVGVVAFWAVRSK